MPQSLWKRCAGGTPNVYAIRAGAAQCGGKRPGCGARRADIVHQGQVLAGDPASYAEVLGCEREACATSKSMLRYAVSSAGGAVQQGDSQRTGQISGQRGGLVVAPLHPATVRQGYDDQLLREWLGGVT